MDKLRNGKRSKTKMGKGNSKSRNVLQCGIIKGNGMERTDISVLVRENTKRIFNMDVKPVCSSAVLSFDSGCLRQPLWRKL
jgi:hypothetical protein